MESSTTFRAPLNKTKFIRTGGYLKAKEIPQINRPSLTIANQEVYFTASTNREGSYAKQDVVSEAHAIRLGGRRRSKTISKRNSYCGLDYAPVDPAHRALRAQRR
jgi:hypothetical protein